MSELKQGIQQRIGILSPTLVLRRSRLNEDGCGCLCHGAIIRHMPLFHYHRSGITAGKMLGCHRPSSRFARACDKLSRGLGYPDVSSAWRWGAILATWQLSLTSRDLPERFPRQRISSGCPTKLELRSFTCSNGSGASRRIDSLMTFRGCRSSSERTVDSAISQMRSWIGSWNSRGMSSSRGDRPHPDDRRVERRRR